jgi:hypothetical protein
MKVLVFLHGTTIMHRKAGDRTREEAVEQVIRADESLHDWASYIPIGNAAGKLRGWRRQGATICYLSPHHNAADVEKDRAVLKKYAFPDGEILFRRSGEGYKDVVERIQPLPDVVVEDDCESIGRTIEMVYPNLKPELKGRVKSIVVREFEGIDYLPDTIRELAQ